MNTWSQIPERERKAIVNHMASSAAKTLRNACAEMKRAYYFAQKSKKDVDWERLRDGMLKRVRTLLSRFDARYAAWRELDNHQHEMPKLVDRRHGLDALRDDLARGRDIHEAMAEFQKGEADT